jgi:hypothetical protein
MENLFAFTGKVAPNDPIDRQESLSYRNRIDIQQGWFYSQPSKRVSPPPTSKASILPL